MLLQILAIVSSSQVENPRYVHCFHDEDAMMWLKRGFFELWQPVGTRS
jgi:hypothetical protein